MKEADDHAALANVVQRHAPGLRAHCYRMLGSFQEAEDLTQEALLRAWRKKDTLRSTSSMRAWLYRIATNACLDHLQREQRRPRMYEPSERLGELPNGGLTMVRWLQPFPDQLLDPVDPETRAVARETISLGFLVAVQHLSPCLP